MTNFNESAVISFRVSAKKSKNLRSHYHKITSTRERFNQFIRPTPGVDLPKTDDWTIGRRSFGTKYGVFERLLWSEIPQS